MSTTRTRRRIAPNLGWTFKPSASIAERPGWRASTLHTRAIYPAMASAGLGPHGVYIGRDLFGSAFTFDPWHNYARGLVGNPNVLVLGSLSTGKSALLKVFALRQHVFGCRFECVDVKSEYGPLMEAIGGSSLSVYRGGPTRLNPLRPGPGGDPAQELTAAVAAAGLGRSLDPAERVGLAAAVEIVTDAALGEHREPTLPDLVAVLLNPPDPLQIAMSSTGAEEPRLELRTLGLGLRSLCEGAMVGMFDGPSTASIDWGAPGVRLDLSQVTDSTSLAVLMTCWMAFLRQQHQAHRAECARRGTTPRRTIRGNDEFWHVAPVEGVAERFTQEVKLSRVQGINQWFILHKLQDAGAGADDGTATAKLMDALIADIDTYVAHRQPAAAAIATVERFGMSRTQSEILPDLGSLQALWQVGPQQILATHEVSSYEASIIDTDAAMRNDVPVAKAAEGEGR